MKVALIGSVRHGVSEPFAGGLEAHTSYLARGLEGLGHEVAVFAAGAADGGFIPSEASRRDVSMNDSSGMLEHHSYLRLMLRLSDSGFDVVQNNSLHYLPVAMSPMLGRPLVTTLHTPPTPWLQSAFRCVGGMATCVSVSHRNAMSWGNAVRVREVIPNGVDLELWPFAPGPAPPATAVWSGRITPEKGPHLALLAAREAGFSLSLAGPVTDEGYFHREVAPLLDSGRRYVGHLTHQHLARLVGAATVALCTPRWDEPYGFVVAEALACGTPVAAFERGAVTEILDKTCGRLASPDDVPGLARAMLEATGLDRRDCRRRAEESCSLRTMVDRYDALYEDLLVQERLDARA